MAGSSSGMSAALEALRTQYIEGWPEKRDRMNGLVERAGGGEEPQDALRDLRMEFHRLAGTGGTYGLPPVTEAGRSAEAFIEPFLDGEQSPSPEEIARIREFVIALDEVFTAAGEGKAPEAAMREPPPAAAALRRIALVDDDPSHAGALGEMQHGKGYELRVWQEGEDPLSFLGKERPDIVVMDARIGTMDGFELCRRVKADPNLSGVPVILTSALTDLEERLKAHRAGGDAFFGKPISLDRFLEYLDLVSGPPPDIPIRILSVEDDPDQASFIRHVLEGADYMVKVCANPEDLLTELEEFNPDLLLMDVMLTGIDGFDLAHVVRQDSRYWMLPIVFLTSVGLASGQKKALEAGSDDYLVKPVDPGLLLQCMRARTQRALLMRARSDQDGLTHILNRASMMRQFDGVLSRARRYGEPLSVAMLDIDRFKSVNDTHGHQVGDAVLRGLAQFLKEELRQSDMVGRYGGEEFIVLFPQSDPASAMSVLDRLRVEFGKREHPLPEGGALTATFSGGIASFPSHGEDRDAIVLAADEALYASKEGGRNRISIAAS